jgi:hypothetical protein
MVEGMTNQDSPLKLAHIEEYRRQKAESDIQFSIDTSSWNGRWYIAMIGSTPQGQYVGGEWFNPHRPFLRWRLKLAKRRLLRQWRIVCEMES